MLAAMDARAAAATDNATVCDAACRAAGLETARDERRWRSVGRSPDLFPDVVTLVPGLTADEVLAGVDVGQGASVKDSFADVDLRVHGFRVLFEAEWIGRESDGAGPTRLDWRLATAAEAPTVMAVASRWTGGPDPRVRLLVGSDHEGIAASVVLSASAWHPVPAVVGVSNVATHRGAEDDVWADLPALVADHAPVAVLVGYERGDALALATAVGFRPLGPLRVWVHD
jgi:hypothetical protein